MTAKMSKSHSFHKIIQNNEQQQQQLHENHAINKSNKQTPRKNDCRLSKKEFTAGEIDAVLRDTQNAWTRDLEAVLLDHEPHVIEYRNEIYLQALANGVTSQSPTEKRLFYIEKVVSFLFMNVEPPNKYTAITDRKHFKEVAALALIFDRKSKNVSVADYDIPLTLVIAAWMHDVERFIPCIKCRYLEENVDHYRKQVIHPITSTKVAQVLLTGAPLTGVEMQRITQLILHHDMPHPTQEICIAGQCILSAVEDGSELLSMLQTLTDADSYAFFQSTIALFIDYKAAKNSSPQLIWKRVLCNLLRLAPHLRAKAVDDIRNLDPELRDQKMIIDEAELLQVLQEEQ
jgi:hypothetical protein